MTMNEHTFRVLEYHEFLELLGRYTSSEPGRLGLCALRPKTDPGEIFAERHLYQDCLDLRSNGSDLPPARFDSPAELLARADDEAVLDVEGFLAIRNLLGTVGSVRAFTEREDCSEAAEVRELGAQLADCPELSGAIDRTFDPGADRGISDRASDKLRKIRNRITTLEQRIRSKLQTMLREPMFKDGNVAMRGGRCVMTVPRELRKRVKGVVHDESNSGRTLYVEPEGLLPQGKEVDALRRDERDEIHRILAVLTSTVLDRRDDLSLNFSLLRRYDMAYAISAWAKKHDCCLPDVGGRLHLIGARHPLLQAMFWEAGTQADLVPLDLEVPDEKNLVVVTGSNAGGKTVILKTVGLLTLIAQTGLPVPAKEGSSLRLFSNVVADIGDEQSLEQNLSTFSGHLEQTIQILETARACESLVLLDELGAGTDPIEGGALGCAILEILSRTEGLTFANTHLGAIKTFAHDHSKMTNACVSFNVQTLRPEYKLQMGKAGASHAFAIAKRLGMPADVLDYGLGAMGNDGLRLETMLSSMGEDERCLQEDRKAAVLAREEAQALRDKLGRRLKGQKKRERQALREAEETAAALLEDTQKEIGNILAQTEKSQGGTSSKQFTKALARARKRLGKDEDAADVPKEEFKVGSRVWVKGVKDHGTICALGRDGKRATVEVGNLRLEVDVLDLAAPQNPARSA
jgi:DNA mismatch repair protein MutS2